MKNFKILRNSGYCLPFKSVELLPVFTSPKIENQLKHQKTKPQLVNQQCVVYDL